MKNELLAKRYTEGLAAALPDDAEYRSVFGEVGEFLGILEGHERLQALLLRPFVSSTKKAEIVEEILGRHQYKDKTRRFLMLLIEHRRLSLLPEIVRTLPSRWKELHGIRTFEVLSVVPLSDGQKKRLEAELSRLENGPVSCSYAQDPAIVGGLFIRKGNRVYDVSVKGGIERMKETIGERVPQHGD
ncbi:MAG: ATP synthase F1 subunit delta [Candidatus Aminicenantes bacterium]|nr:ATP synthase F1 subunit delta [Candidatus Aminicenantes bacterium]